MKFGVLAIIIAFIPIIFGLVFWYIKTIPIIMKHNKMCKKKLKSIKEPEIKNRLLSSTYQFCKDTPLDYLTNVQKNNIGNLLFNDFQKLSTDYKIEIDRLVWEGDEICHYYKQFFGYGMLFLLIIEGILILLTINWIEISQNVFYCISLGLLLFSLSMAESLAFYMRIVKELSQFHDWMTQHKTNK